MFENKLFRASQIGALMTNPRSKSELLSETTKSKLIEIYIEDIYGIDNELHSKYIEKGLGVEEESLTLASSVDKEFYVKNEKTFKNDFISGFVINAPI